MSASTLCLTVVVEHLQAVCLPADIFFSYFLLCQVSSDLFPAFLISPTLIFSHTGDGIKFEKFYGVFKYCCNVAFPVKMVENYPNFRYINWVTKNIVEEGIFLRNLLENIQNTSYQNFKTVYCTLKTQYATKVVQTNIAYYNE